ncbi:MAG: hypothetical protein WDM71_04060 [Ferruginibacter sp.]
MKANQWHVCSQLAEIHFTIDSSLRRLPLSEKFSARIPVFTGFPSDRIILSQQDSSLLRDVKSVSLAIQKRFFLYGINRPGRYNAGQNI